MKAIVNRNYGSPDVLKCEEIDKPTPGDNEVLIRVRAASVNPLDCHFVTGKPYFIRLMTGLRKPKFVVPGVDVSGHVEAVGKSVTRLKPGDEVFGSSRGAFAEYACTRESALALKPESVTFEQAAAVPVAGVTALQGLRDNGKIQPGQKVLINGAAGGVGTFAVQIAKSCGAVVTGVCSSRNLEMVRSLGAHHVIDYTREDFARRGDHYDVIIDCFLNHSLSDCRRALSPKGIYVFVGSPNKSMIGLFVPVLGAFALSLFASQKLVMCMARVSKDDLTALGGLLATGEVTPVIDRRYKLDEVPQAIAYLEEGHARGKVIIDID